jgi:uncharacterized membrane protein YhiD involved in acid resistance
MARDCRTDPDLRPVLAASIWVTAGLGIACGAGAWVLAGVAAIAVIVVPVVGLHIDEALYGRLGPEDEQAGEKLSAVIPQAASGSAPSAARPAAVRNPYSR